MRRMLITAVLALLLAAAFSFAQQSSDVLITDVWARPTSLDGGMGMDMDMGDDNDETDMDMEATEEAPMTIPPSAAYMQIENTGDNDLRLIAAESPVANQVEIHETSIEDDVMRMRELENGLDVPAGESVLLEQGGFHVMLMALTRELVPGDALPLTLIFAVVEDGEATDETVSIYMGVPVLERAPDPVEDIVIQGVWARSTGAGGMMGMDMSGDSEGDDMGDDMNMEATEEAPMAIPPSAVYMTITNLSSEDETLVSARTDVAGLVEIHETTIEDDVMRMRELENGLTIPAGETAILEQGGLHVMLLDLQEELIEGEAIAVTLVFESGTEITIGAPVAPMPPFE